jgi:alpha-N-arabinofuranosidase
VDYTNCQSGTPFSTLRAANGSGEPHGVKLWCLGNEMDGPWQLGHAPAAEYALRAEKAIALMRAVDPALELVACGSCSITLPTYVEWDRSVLEYLGDSVEYLSLHRYARNPNNDTADFLAITNSIDRQIEAMDTVCRYAAAKRRDAKRVYLCFDEWNVWHKNKVRDGEGKLAPHLLEEVYDLQDALVVAGFLNSFIRHADSVKIANLAQIVNVIAPILTRDDDLLLQSIYHPFAMFSKRRNGIALRPAVSGPMYDSPSYGQTCVVDHSAILDGDRLHVFLTNRSQHEAAPVRIVLADREIGSLHSGELLTGPHPLAANTFENPNIITPHVYDDVLFERGGASLFLPPLSVAAFTLQLA